MAKYQIGQKINLWQIHVDGENRTTHVLKSVLVTVTEVKTGVLEDYTDKPSTDESVRAVTEDGQVYERFWDRVPISQTTDFYGQWSLRDDGENIPGYPNDYKFWSPKEAWVAYKDFLRYSSPKYNIVDRIVGPDGQAIVPKGDVVKCETHGTYQPPHINCFDCYMDERFGKKAG